MFDHFTTLCMKGLNSHIIILILFDGLLHHHHHECAKLRVLRALVPYMSCVPLCLTYPCALHALAL